MFRNIENGNIENWLEFWLFRVLKIIQAVGNWKLLIIQFCTNRILFCPNVHWPNNQFLLKKNENWKIESFLIFKKLKNSLQ